MLSGQTSVIMTGEEMCPLTPELLLANHKRKEVENWRNLKRSEAKARMAEISRLEGEIATEMAEIEELMVSPKAWTRKGQAEIAQQVKALVAHENSPAGLACEGAFRPTRGHVTTGLGWLGVGG